ncbi:MAG: hypothetical protein U0470_11470 [Anaerolineae bacterium]
MNASNSAAHVSTRRKRGTTPSARRSARTSSSLGARCSRAHSRAIRASDTPIDLAARRTSTGSASSVCAATSRSTAIIAWSSPTNHGS